jgi:26S proteasome regulatory subunit N5
MVRLSLHQDDYLATTKHYLAVYHTLVTQEETLQARAILQNVLIFVILSPYGNEQSDLLARVVREDPVKNGQMGWVGKFVQSFTNGELLRYQLPLSRC